MNKKRKLTKKIAAWFMCLAMVLTTINLPAFMTEVKAAGIEIPQGTGTSENPYQISTAEELFWFADAVKQGNSSICAELTNNIVINSEGNPSPIVWPPIGTITNNFKGTFDGQGYTIKGVYINDETSDYKGLFGYCNGSTIRDLTVVVDLTGKGYVGGICGKLYNGTVENCSVSGSVSSTSSYVGGICGCLIESTVENCSVSGSVSSTSSNAGGICGYLIESTVENCSVSGSVSSTSSYVGGIVGYNDNGSIRKCYNSGSVQGESLVGGICGRFDGGNLANCYNTGNIGYKGEIGGICGRFAGGNISKCYNLGTISHIGSGYYGSVIGYGGSNSITDCYYLIGQDSVSDSYAESKTADQFARGEVAWLLNGETSEGEDLAWYQTIGTDNYPNFNSVESGVVYFSYADCSATEKSYSNSVGSDTQGNHDFVVIEGDSENHKCSVCGTQRNHDFSADAEVVKIDGTKHGKECSICHEVLETGNHNFLDSEGKPAINCTLCNATNTQKCGADDADVYYTYSEDGKTLYIYGSGPMNNYSEFNYPNYMPPWFWESGSPITNVVISDGVTSIGDFAFYVCESLTSITIPSSVTSIGYLAFGYCYSLTSVTISNGVTSIGDYAFEDCESLTSITIPDSVINIGGYAFELCSNLNEITIENPNVSLGSYVFRSCLSLKTIILNCKNLYIGEDNDSYWLDKGVSDYENIVKINHDFVNKECSVCKVKECVITGNHDFSKYQPNKEATCKDNATEIGTCICGAEDEREIEGTKLDTHTFVNGVCSVCDKIWEVTENGITYKAITEEKGGKPVGVTVSGNDIDAIAVSVVSANTVDESVSDNSVVIAGELTGNGTEQKFIVTKIEKDAFAGSGMNSLVIPASVTELGENALGNASNVTFEGMNPPDGIASAIKENATIHIPEGSKDNYQIVFNNIQITINEAHTHKFAEEWSYDKDNHWKASACGHDDTVVKLTHTFGEWITVKDACETEEGSKKRVCACGYEETEAIAKLEVKPSDKPADVKPSEKPSEDVKPSEQPKLTKQTITVAKAAKKTVTFKASKLKAKKATLKLGAKAKTKLSYKVSKYPKNAKKYISVSSKGVVTMKKGAKKGTYKVTITAKADKKYEKATKVITIKVK